jgi:hypothetical protein
MYDKIKIMEILEDKYLREWQKRRRRRTLYFQITSYGVVKKKLST